MMRHRTIIFPFVTITGISGCSAMVSRQADITANSKQHAAVAEKATSILADFFVELKITTVINMVADTPPRKVDTRANWSATANI